MTLTVDIMFAAHLHLLLSPAPALCQDCQPV